MSVISSPLARHERQRPGMICDNGPSPERDSTRIFLRTRALAQIHDVQGRRSVIMPNKGRPQVLSRSMTVPFTFSSTRSPASSHFYQPSADRESVYSNVITAPQPKRPFNFEDTIDWEKLCWWDLKDDDIRSARSSRANFDVAIRPVSVGSEFSVLLHPDDKAVVGNKFLFTPQDIDTISNRRATLFTHDIRQSIGSVLSSDYKSCDDHEEEEEFESLPDELLYSEQDIDDLSQQSNSEASGESGPSIPSKPGPNPLTTNEGVSYTPSTTSTASFMDTCQDTAVSSSTDDIPNPDSRIRLVRGRWRQLLVSRTRPATQGTRVSVINLSENHKGRPKCANSVPAAYEPDAVKLVVPMVKLIGGERDYESQDIWS